MLRQVGYVITQKFSEFPVPGGGRVSQLSAERRTPFRIPSMKVEPVKVGKRIWVAMLLAIATGVAPRTALPPAMAAEADAEGNPSHSFRLPAGWAAERVAAEPLLVNPVAFSIDPRGTIYVCETQRQGRGVEDNRDHAEWLLDDLAARTVDDRLAYLRKHLGADIERFTRYEDRVKALFDDDGDGVIDRATVFADGFNEVLDGTAAGVLAWRDRVYLAAIPGLYRLADRDGDGQADHRETLGTGYGVRFAFRGHDLHGLVMGPDGRLYFTIGDRGYDVEQQGVRVADPESGAVFRCEPDGSGLEVIATGLRNPQELAFDDEGALFTCDNNSDSGDLTRWLAVLDGADYGWRMAFQYLPDRGPYNRERLWHAYDKRSTPPSVVPPVAVGLCNGPSGLTFAPTVGVPQRYRGCFFLADFGGSPVTSGVRSLRVRPRGAFHEVSDVEQTIWQVLATDVEFGLDGRLYVSDWVEGWTGADQGRLHAFRGPTTDDDATSLTELRALLSDGLESRADSELVALLGAEDRRLRQAAQFALVERGRADALAAAAVTADGRLARLHALWGLGQCGRRGETTEAVAAATTILERSAGSGADPEDDAVVRAAAVQLLGGLKSPAHAPRLVERLADPDARVRYAALMALAGCGAVGEREVAAILEVIAANDDDDPALRHAGIMALTGAATDALLVAAADHPALPVRLAVAAALGRRGSGAIAALLDDPDEAVVAEAARAIYDRPLPDQLSRLADLAERPLLDPVLWHRVLAACFRLGRDEDAERLVSVAARADVDAAVREQAIELLDRWDQTMPLDPVLGLFRPRAAGDGRVVAHALEGRVGPLLAAPAGVARRSAALAARLGLGEARPLLVAVLADARQPAEARAAAVRSLGALDACEAERESATPPEVAAVLDDPSDLVRAAALRVSFHRADHQVTILPRLVERVASGTVHERQDALRLLAEIPSPDMASLLVRSLDRLATGGFPAEAALELLAAAEASGDARVAERLAEYRASRDVPDDPLAGYRETLFGGDAARGREVFVAKTSVSCVRCHRVGNVGGDVGPRLDGIGRRRERDFLLESIVAPDRVIADGYESAIVLTADGRQYQGIVRRDGVAGLELVTPEGRRIEIAADDIEQRVRGPSAMPADLVGHLSLFEIRDLVEYLASLDGTRKKRPGTRRSPPPEDVP
jgi:quinoprotein glucose dehydrogenase